MFIAFHRFLTFEYDEPMYQLELSRLLSNKIHARLEPSNQEDHDIFFDTRKEMMAINLD